MFCMDHFSKLGPIFDSKWAAVMMPKHIFSFSGLIYNLVWLGKKIKKIFHTEHAPTYLEHFWEVWANLDNPF